MKKTLNCGSQDTGKYARLPLQVFEPDAARPRILGIRRLHLSCISVASWDLLTCTQHVQASHAAFR